MLICVWNLFSYYYNKAYGVFFTTVRPTNIWVATWQKHRNDCAPSEDSDQPGHPPVWSESSLSAWRKLRSLDTHWAHSELWSEGASTQSDQSLRWAHSHFVCFVMSRLIFVLRENSIQLINLPWVTFFFSWHFWWHWNYKKFAFLRALILFVREWSVSVMTQRNTEWLKEPHMRSDTRKCTLVLCC